LIYLCSGYKRTPIGRLGNLLDFTRCSKMMMWDNNGNGELAPKNCYWVGWHALKGATCHVTQSTVIGLPQSLPTLHHDSMLQGFAGVDKEGDCYLSTSLLGFGTFIKWMYFVHPEKNRELLGIDFNLSEREVSGVATSVTRVAQLAKILISQGLKAETPLTLLDRTMWEPELIADWRVSEGLFSAADFVNWRKDKCSPNGAGCPKCGQKSFTQKIYRFCVHCGFDKNKEI
jgi:hypothetical protein